MLNVIKTPFAMILLLGWIAICWNPMAYTLESPKSDEDRQFFEWLAKLQGIDDPFGKVDGELMFFKSLAGSAEQVTLLSVSYHCYTPEISMAEFQAKPNEYIGYSFSNAHSSLTIHQPPVSKNRCSEVRYFFRVGKNQDQTVMVNIFAQQLNGSWNLLEFNRSVL